MPTFLKKGDGPMRKMAIFAFSFAAAAALHVYLLSASLGLALGTAVLGAGIVLCFFHSGPVKRLRIAAFGLALGLLWSGGYEYVRIAPLLAQCGTGREITAEICEVPEATEWGCAVISRTEGGKIRLYLDADAADLALGDRVTVTADVDSVLYSAQWNALYYQSRDISLVGRQSGGLSVEKAQRLPLRCWPQYAAAAAGEKLRAIFPEDTGGFVTALLLGDKEGLSYRQKNNMSLSGVSHVVAVSGLHLSILMTALGLFLRRRRLVAIIALPVLWIFAAMVGFTPSVTRAAVMQSFLLLAPILKREYDTPTALGSALLFLLLENPWAIANVSLQLSFGAVAGIVFCTGPSHHWLMGHLAPEGRKLWRPLRRLAASCSAGVATTLGALVFTTPLTALYFGQVSLISVLSNLLLLPLISLCFVLILVALLLGFVYTPLGTLLGGVIAWPLRLFLWAVERLADLPNAAVYTESFYAVLWLLLSYVLLGIFLLGKGRRLLCLLTGLVISLAGMLLFSSLQHGSLKATVLDVGQGQCILLRSGGMTAVVDCGGDQGDPDGEKAARTLLSEGVDAVDVLVLTHYDVDHTCGLEQLLSRVTVETILAPDLDEENREAVLALAARHGVPVELVTADLDVSFSGGTFRVMAPVDPENENVGLCALLSVQEYDILITGDMDAAGERALLRTHVLPDIELLVAGHHGSKYATSEALLAAAAPEAVVISVGDNSFGHPTQEVLDRVAAIGAALWRTDLDGDITITR